MMLWLRYCSLYDVMQCKREESECYKNSFDKELLTVHTELLPPLVVSEFCDLPAVITSTTLWMTILYSAIIKFPLLYQRNTTYIIYTLAHTLYLHIPNAHAQMHLMVPKQLHLQHQYSRGLEHGRDDKKNSVAWVRERTIPTEQPPMEAMIMLINTSGCVIWTECQKSGKIA
jgi:hypothetical protein